MLVVDAVLDLFEVGELDPAPAAIAARAGVSERSLFRYFDGLDDLRQAVLARAIDRSEHFLRGPSAPGSSAQTRIQELVGLRLDLWTATRGATQVALVRARFVPAMATEVDRFRHRLHEQAATFFEPELGRWPPRRRQELLLAVDALTSFGAFDLMVTAHGCTVDTVRRVWTTALAVLLGVG